MQDKYFKIKWLSNQLVLIKLNEMRRVFDDRQAIVLISI
jgi:hypothetical protein